MNRNDIAIKGSAIGITSQILNLLVKFAVRTFAIRYLGMDILGLDSVLLDTISMLSLADMGITSAMIYRLYRPIVDNDTKRISELMAAFRFIYRLIACIVAILGIIISFFVPYIIKDISVPMSQIYAAFYLQLVCTVSSYLLAYQRLLLNADQRKHVCLIVDSGATVLFSLLKVIVIIYLKSYIVYIFLSVLQTVFANVVLLVYLKNKYHYINNRIKRDKNDIRVIMMDTKEVLGNKIAGYIYSGTDNMIISIFRGTGVVGILSNYKYISSALKGIVNSSMSTIQPLIGNYLNSDIPKEDSFKTLMRYTFIRYIIAGVSVIPFIVVVDVFIFLWTQDAKAILPSIITIMLAADYYIGCIFGPLGEYLAGLGEFRKSKNTMLAGSVTNIVLSLLGVITLGYEGVLIATVFSQFVIWATNALYVFKCYYNKEYGIRYVIKQLLCICILVLSVIISIFVDCQIKYLNYYIHFIVGAIISIFVFVVLSYIAFRNSDELCFMINMTKRIVKKLYRKG